MLCNINYIIMSPSIENDSNATYRNIILATVIVLAIGLRFLPVFFILPFNFSPINAVALFSGLYFAKKYQSIIFPLFTIWISDLFINYSYTGVFSLFYDGFYWQYGSYVLIALIGIAISQEIKYSKILAATLVGTLLFYIVSNFGVWISYNMYSHDFTGLMNCYVAGIPFLRNALIGDLLFSTVLFLLVKELYKRFKVAVV